MSTRRVRDQIGCRVRKNYPGAIFKSCAGSDDSSRTKSSSFPTYPSPSGCDEGDDVPVDSLTNRNIDASSRHGLIRQFLTHHKRAPLTSICIQIKVTGG